MAPRTFVQITLLSAAAALVGCASAPAGREADEALLKDPLLSKAKVAHEVVPEAFITALTPADNLDSPASWMAPDGRRWVIATAKGTHALVVFDGDSGKRLRVVGGKGKALGKLDRPNGISVVDDLVFVVERDNRRVQVFSLPDLTPVTAFGQNQLREPYGLWVRKHEGGYEVVVSDNYMSPANKDLPPPLAELG
ncbi:phytase, partial [Xanthomonas perforans]